jgi:hypothetical protein
MGLLRATLSCDHDREGLPVIAKSTYGFHEFRRRTVAFDTHDHSNFFTRFGARNV